MTFSLITKKEDWNPKARATFIPFTQDWSYGEWQDEEKKVFRIRGETNGNELILAQILKYKLPYGKSYLYCPYGPLADKNLTKEDKCDFIKFVTEIAQKENVIFLRVDQNIFGFPKMKYINSFQPPSEQVIDIGGPIEEVLKKTDKNIRYSINLAKKSGVEVEIVDSDLLGSFDELFEAFSLSAKRNEIGLHPKEYYKKILEVGEKEKNAFLTFTRFEGKVLVASLTVLSGNRATQIFSGSTDFYRKLRPAAITRLESITYAKNRGMTQFSLGGVTSDVHPVKKWTGISEFKKQFGGRVEISADPGVLIFRPFWYALYNLKKFFK